MYDTYKDLYLCKKTWKKVASNYTIKKWFKGLGWCEICKCAAIKVTTKENAIKNTFDKRFAIPLEWHAYGRKEELIVGMELNSSEKMILCSGDITAIDRLPDISL